MQNNLFRHIFILILSLAASLHLYAAPPHCLSSETLTYKVMFKWGLINKQAGRATLTLQKYPNEYKATLSARSEPWADRIYKVRDTLNGRMTTADFTPLFYEKIANEGSERKHDVVSYNYATPKVVRAHCTRKVFKKGVLKIDQQQELQADSAAIDMLSSFYYMRSLPYPTMKAGQQTRIDIFSGKRKELLTIKYHGIVDANLDGETAKTYYITFTFTSGSGKKTSDDMEAWISTDSERIPLRLEGKLPVGNVHCIYTGKLQQP